VAVISRRRRRRTENLLEAIEGTASPDLPDQFIVLTYPPPHTIIVLVIMEGDGHLSFNIYFIRIDW